jgi:glycerol-3-phosphate dehydrogenase (NAD(P)+)
VINHGSNVEEAYRGLMVETPGHEVHGSGFCVKGTVSIPR